MPEMIALPCMVLTAMATQSAPAVSLDGCTIVTSAFQPAYVARALEDLRGRLGALAVT